MLKFVVVGDIHYRGSNPRSRIDDYPAAIRAKIEEVNEIAEEIQADGILCPGDLCDSPNMSFRVTLDLHNVLNGKWYIVPGNHDEYGANLDSLIRTPFGFLGRIGSFNSLEPGLCHAGLYHCVPRGQQKPTAIISGSGYCADMDIDPLLYQPGDINGLSKFLGPYFRIHLVHGMAVDHPLPDMVRHTRIDQVETDADVVITGHDHTGYGIRRIGKTLWINPGALCRVSASVVEMERPIQVAILTVNDDGTCDAELVPLQSAKPGHEVLSREHLEQQAAREQHTAEFLAQLQDAKEILDPAGLVDMIAGLEKVPERVRNEALQRLGTAKEKLGVTA